MFNVVHVVAGADVLCLHCFVTKSLDECHGHDDDNDENG